MDSQTIHLSLSLKISDPGQISISKPELASSLKVIATVRQQATPFPGRHVTLLTRYSVLDTCIVGAFYHRLLGPAVDISNDTAMIKMFYMGPMHIRCHDAYPDRGNSDMRLRERHKFITVPPLGQGSAEVAWSIAPDDLLYHYDKQGDMTQRLAQFHPGQKFKFEAHSTSLRWWTFGSLDTDLKSKKFSRWTLPDALPLVREDDADESVFVDHRLVDQVDGTDLGSVVRQFELPGTPDPEDEVPPKVKALRADGWVLGEPLSKIKMTWDEQPAVFEFVE